MFFESAYLPFLQSSVNTLLEFLQDAPVGLLVMTFFISWVVCWLPIAAIITIVLNWQINKSLQSQQKLLLLVPLYLLAPLTLWGFSRITHTSFVDYGLESKISVLSSLGLGFILGVFSLAIVFICQYWLGWCDWESSHHKLILPSLLPILLVAFFVSGIEELVFRGFLFQELAQDYPIWGAAIASSLIFALLHLVWEQKETAPQLPGLWLMGMVLVLARFTDGGSLGIAWGLHAGWVWAIATIDTAQLITYTGKVSEWYTGKNKKPLAGWAGIICVLGAGILLWSLSIIEST